MSSDSKTLEDALLWLNSLFFEDKFHKIIELLGRDTDINNLTNSQIIQLYKHFA